MIGKPIGIMLVEDHSIFRNSLFKLITSQVDMDVCAQTGKGEEVLSLYQLHRPDYKENCGS